MDNYTLKNAIIHSEDFAKRIVAHQQFGLRLTHRRGQAEIKSKKNSVPLGLFRNGSTSAHCFHNIILPQKTLSVSLNNQ